MSGNETSSPNVFNTTENLLLKILSALFLALVLLVGNTACDPYKRIATGTDVNAKYELAKKFYNRKDFARAQPLFEDLLAVYRGSSKAEDVYYYYAYTQFGLGNYTLASMHFKNYAESFPNSALAEECAWMQAYCFALESAPRELDQANTSKAIEGFQLFVNRFPQSTRIDTSNAIIDKLRRKLQIKAFNQAYLYYQIQDYRAAAVAMRALLKEYPDLEEREKVEYLVFRSYYLWAENSIIEKRKERFVLAQEALTTFRSDFPTSRLDDGSGKAMRDIRKALETTAEIK